MFSVQVDKHFKKISGITNIEKMVPSSELLLNEALSFKTRVLKQRHVHQAWTQKKNDKWDQNLACSSYRNLVCPLAPNSSTTFLTS